MIDPPNREVALFTEALKLPAEKRAAYLDEACAGDGALRQRVEAFLLAHDQAGAFLEDSAAGAERGHSCPAVPPRRDASAQSATPVRPARRTLRPAHGQRPRDGHDARGGRT